MTAEERDDLRARIDAHQRERLQVPTCPYGSMYGYKKGCRCSECRRASRSLKQAYRAANPDYVERENARRSRRRAAA